MVLLWLRRLLVPALLAAPLVLVLRWGTSASLEGSALLWLALGLYALCCSIAATALVGSRVPGGVVLQLVAGLAWGGVFALHLREVTAFPPTRIGLAATALLSGAAAALTLRLLCGHQAPEEASTRSETYLPERQSRGLIWLGASLVAATLVPVLLYTADREVRWHLLHHAKVLGSPVQRLLGTAPAAREAEDLVGRALEGTAAASTIQQRFAPPATPFEAEADTPNLVFVMIDTLRADALWPELRAAEFDAETDAVAMPQLAASFERCQRFTDVLANSSWTRPSIASMFTGLLPEHHGSRGVADPLEPGHSTFVEHLQAGGYETIGLVANPTAGVNSGLDQGFDQFLEVERNPYARAEIIGKAALRFLDEREAALGAQAKPLFFYLHYLDPHEPYLAGYEPNGWSRSSYQRAYGAELEYLDDQLAETLPAIRSKLGADTLFFFVSDHGEEFFEHELFGHGHTLYDEVLRIPAALCGGPFEGGEQSARLEGRDVFSLMLGLANGSVRSNLDLQRWATTHTRTRRHASLSFRGFGNLVLRPYLQSVYQRATETEDGKWIWNAYGDTWEHYLASDPLEQTNTAYRQPAGAAAIEAASRAIEAGAPAPWYQPEPIQANDEQKQRLKRIGYVQ